MDEPLNPKPPNPKIAGRRTKSALMLHMFSNELAPCTYLDRPSDEEVEEEEEERRKPAIDTENIPDDIKVGLGKNPKP